MGFGRMGARGGFGSMGNPLGTVSNPPALFAAFIASLSTTSTDKQLNVIGDSTGNGNDEWVYISTLAIEAKVSTRYIDYYLYDDPTKSYILSALLGRRSNYSLMQETFSRADGSVGTTSSGGQTWAANSWNIVSGVGVPSATSAPLQMTASFASSSFKVQYNVKFPASGQSRFYALTAGSSQAKYLAVFVDSVGAVSLVCQDGTGAVTIGSMNSLGQIAGNIYTITVVKDGLRAWVQINGPDMATTGGPRQFVASISSAQDAALTGRNALFLVTTTTTGQGIQNVLIGDIIVPANKLVVKNASVSGENFAYFTTNIATIVPEAPSIIIVSNSINETTDGPTFIGQYKTFVSLARSQTGVANLPIVATMQNPTTDGIAAAQAARMLALKPACAINGWDRIDAFDAFNSSPIGLALLLNPDGRHPSPLYGSPLWATTVEARGGFS